MMVMETYVVDYQRDSGNINSTSQNVGRDEDLSITTTEGINDSITLGTLHTTGQGGDGVTFGDHATLDFGGRMTGLKTISNFSFVISSSTYPDEDDGRSDGEQPVKLNKVLIFFLLASAIHVELLNALNCQLLVLKSDFIGTGSEFACVAIHVCGESGGEQNNLDIAGDHSFVRQVSVEENPDMLH